MFDDLLTEFTEMKAELQKRQEVLSVSLRPKFQAAFAPFFERHPKLEKISFGAYTPYFNDGEECVYSVHEPEMTACGVEEISEYTAKSIANAIEYLITGKIPSDVQSHYDRWAHKNYPTAEAYLRAGSKEYLDFGLEGLSELCTIAAEYPAIKKIVEAVPDEVMKGMFGDHVKVTITASGVEADEFDHD